MSPVIDTPTTVGDALRALRPAWKGATRKRWLAEGRVRVNGVPARRANIALAPGDVLDLDDAPGASAGPPARTGDAPPFPLLHVDADLIVVDKPAGLRSVADARERERTVPRLLKQWLAARPRGVPPPRVDTGREGPGCWVAHRLDRETSGVLALARSREAKRRLVAAWGAVEKMYWAVTDGLPPQPEGVIDFALKEDAGLFVRVSRDADAAPARTTYRVLAADRGRALVAVFPHTGRKHQIRVHMAAVGAPLAGDARYGRADSAPRLALHAARLTLPHPFDGTRLAFSSPYPAEWTRFFPEPKP